uniref:Uncharacterized protein n=1 Tax=Anopheles farauti TaxID=69004 RepID=A0A182QZQ4_9DIPT
MFSNRIISDFQHNSPHPLAGLIFNTYLHCGWCNVPQPNVRCRTDYHGACTLNQLQVTTTGWMDHLRAIYESSRYAMVIIKRCKLAESIVPMGRFLEAIGVLYDDVTFQHYHEPVLPITSRMVFESIALSSAPRLTQLAITPNGHLQRLYIVESGINHVPATVLKLPRLQMLGIERSPIRVLDLGLVCGLPSLRTLQLSRNEVSLLLPAPSDTTCANRDLRDLHLDRNRLTVLDVALFAPFASTLTRLLLDQNGLRSVRSSRTIEFPRLTLLTLDGNNLSSVDIAQLHLPARVSIFLADNQFKQVPPLSSDSIPDLQHVYLTHNGLRTLDLATFGVHRHLDGFYFADNQLETVGASRHLELVNVTSIDLARNRLETFSLANCSFPALASVSLANNRLRYVPADMFLANVGPSLHVIITHNPVRCSSVQQNMQLFIHPTLPKLTGTVLAVCHAPYNGSIGMPWMDKLNSICCLDE